jgi:hypothetical protein
LGRRPAALFFLQRKPCRIPILSVCQGFPHGAAAERPFPCAGATANLFPMRSEFIFVLVVSCLIVASVVLLAAAVALATGWWH